MKNRITQIFLTSVFAVLFTACLSGGYYSGGGYYGGGGGGTGHTGGGSSGGGSSSGGGTIDPYYEGWYTVYGYECGYTPGPGCNYFYDSYNDFVKIIDVEDPYYYGTYIWDNYYDYYYGEWVWESPSGIIYDDWGNALNSNSSDVSKDLVGDVAEQENAVIEEAGKAFAAKFALSEEVGIKAAKTMHDWAVLGKTRARTEADVKAVTEQLWGVDFNKVSGALEDAQKGNLASVDEVLEESAKTWKTSPENMKKIVKSFFDKTVPAVKNW